MQSTRGSDHGLDKDFNSLKAQQAICSSYIKSQEHRGWTELHRTYEDASESGATLDRPAMKALLADIERGRVDVVVVYKLDRLSRSLLDFVRLMDVFRRYDVLFACITQNFDTDDSLGRLVMNVLLTFAQFEREMTGDRIRDKKRAMCIKGLWSGGRPPLGYDLVRHRLIVNEEEAAIVRFIYDAYLKEGTLYAVERACRVRGCHSKTYMPGTGILHEGRPLRATNVRKILMNPVYAGFLFTGGKLYRGINRPIVSIEQWEAVSRLRQEQAASRAKLAPADVLGGLIYDCFGRSMTANRLFKRGKLHVYYRSNQNSWGVRHGVKRMGARSAETEQVVVSAIQGLLCDRPRLRSLLLDLGRHGPELAAACRKGPIAARRLDALSREQLRSVLQGLIVRIELSREQIKIVTRALEYENLIDWDFVGLMRRRTEDTAHSPTFLIDVQCAGTVRLERRLRLPIVERKPQTCRINKSLRKLIADVRDAWSMIENHRDVAPEEIARQSNMSVGKLMSLLRLKYLAPDIVISILDGAQPRELTRRALVDANLPLDWVLQRRLFGFPEQPPTRTSERTH